MQDLPERALVMAKRMAETALADDLDSTLLPLTRAAVEMLPGVDEATITLRHSDGALQSYASTADFLQELDDWLFEYSEGPCYDGVTHNAVTVCGDLARDPRYPTYGPRAAAAGIKSQAGLRLFEAPGAVGGLNLYSHSSTALADVGFLAELFAEHARSAVTYAREIDGLRDAITTRQKIGQAVGIVMERYDLRGDRAFAFLARLSSTRNVKLRDVAEEIIADRADPDAGGR